MTRSESKYFNTALLMDQALIHLLEEKDFEYITIKEICARAGVNRSTFYLHYETVADLLAETLEYYNRQFLERFPTTPQQIIPNIQSIPLSNLVFMTPDYLHPYLTFIQEHKSVYKAAFKNPACMQTKQQFEGISRHILMPILQRFSIPEKDQAYYVQYYIHGCTAIIQEWIRRDCADPMEDIENILSRCANPTRPKDAETT